MGGLLCVFTGMYAYIIQSAKNIPSYCPMSPKDKQPALLCKGVLGQCVYRQRAESRQCPRLWCKLEGLQ